MRMLLNWVLSALAVWIVSRVVPGISVSGPVAALIAALVIGFINATVGVVLKILTFPLTLVTPLPLPPVPLCPPPVPCAKA